MTPQQIDAMKMALEKIARVNAMDYEYQAWAREALAEHAMQEVQRLGQEIEPDDIASILACRDMLDAQPVPPRTWVGSGDLEDSNAYLTPPQRKPLTDEQIEQLEQDTCAMEFPETVRAIEAAHGIKGDA
jgi:hypothetical protein